MFLSFIMTRRVYWKCKQCYKALQWINRAPPRDKGWYPYARARGLFSVVQDRTALLLSHTRAGHLIESLHISRWHHPDGHPGGFEHHSLIGMTGWPNKWSPDHPYQTLSPTIRWDWQWLAFPGHPCHCALYCSVSALPAVLQRKVLVELCTWKRQTLLGNIWLAPHMSHTTRWGQSGSCKCQGRSTNPMQSIWMELLITDFGGDIPVVQW